MGVALEASSRLLSGPPSAAFLAFVQEGLTRRTRTDFPMRPHLSSFIVPG